MASTIGGCLDILNLLGDHVNNKNLLYNLCLVSRHFNHIFSKRLWRCLEFEDFNKHCLTDDERRSIILQSPSLQHTRILIYSIDKPSSKNKIARNRVFLECVAELAELVQKLPNLESIVAHELDVSDDIMLALSSATSLKSLVLHFSEDIIFDLGKPNSDIEWHHRPHCILPPFGNLTRLTLLEIFGQLSYWLEWILDLLCQSPTLEHLSLSIGVWTQDVIESCEADEWNLSYHTFFSDLCNKYGNQFSKKLKLRSLRLKEPIRCPDLPTLSKLTDTTYLEDIYVDISFRNGYSGLDVLSSNATPSLRRLTMMYIDHTVGKELSPVTDRRLSILSLEYRAINKYRYFPGPVAESTPSINFLYWPTDAGVSHSSGHKCSKSIGVYLELVSWDDEEIDKRQYFIDLFERLGRMGSLEEIWFEEYTKTKSHASITPEEACDLQYVLSRLAVACRRLHYVKIDRLAWRIHPKVRHTKQQICFFEEIDAWEAAAEGPAAFSCPGPLGRDVVREDWW